MEFNKIIAVTGKPGLFEVISQTKTGIIVKSLADGKRFPILSTHNVSLLENIAIYTHEEDVPLLTVFKTMTSLFNILGIEVKLLYVNVPGQGYKSTNEIDQCIANFIIHLKGDYKLLPQDVTVYSDYSIEKGIFNYAKKFPKAIEQLSQWLAEGKLTYAETVVEGFDTIPQAFLDLFDGKNNGKMLVKI